MAFDGNVRNYYDLVKDHLIELIQFMEKENLDNFLVRTKEGIFIGTIADLLQKQLFDSEKKSKDLNFFLTELHKNIKTLRDKYFRDEEIVLFLEELQKKVAETMIKLKETQRMYKENVQEVRKAEKVIDRRTGINSLTKYGFMYRLKNSTELMSAGSIKSIALIFIDGNSLKDINERFGHDAGQQSIFKTGKVLKKFLDEIGGEYRISNLTGGDERVISLIDMPKKKVEEFLNKVFDYLSKTEITLGKLNLKLSVTAGVTYFIRNEKDAFILNTDEFSEKLLKVADILCLSAKRKRFSQIRKLDKQLARIFDKTNISAKEMIKLKQKEEEDVKNKSTYIIKDYKKIDIDKLLKGTISSLPKKRSRQGLLKMSIEDLRALRFETRERLKRARNSRERNILNENLILLNFVIRDKMYGWFLETLEKLEANVLGKFRGIDLQLNELEDFEGSSLASKEILKFKQLAVEENNELALRILRKYEIAIQNNIVKIEKIKEKLNKTKPEIKKAFDAEIEMTKKKK